jgi:alkylresorcinol/alkylpyrone synthase/polyketide synthase Type III
VQERVVWTTIEPTALPPVRLLGLASAVPPAIVGQDEACRLLGYTDPKAIRVFRNAGVESRNLGLDPATFRPTETPDELAARFERVAMEIGATACRRALEAAAVAPTEVAAVLAATCTGYLCPGIATRLVPALGLPDSVERGELVGHGCSGAFPALQRACDFARAHPGKAALVLCVEVCSAAYFVDDDPETMVANALCADGAAAVVLRAGEGPGPTLASFASALAPEHLGLVGFRRRDGYLRVRLDESVPELAGPLLRRAVDRLLGEAGLRPGSVSRWALHPGGRRVLERSIPAAGLPAAAALPSAKVYREHGNMSSPTVLFVLEEVLRGRPLAPGETLVMAGLGPGFVAEAALLRG